MLDKKGFDLWANGYDKAVGISDAENTYPFAGYRDVLNGIYREIMQKPNAAVLDIGFGTGTLASKLYQQGYDIYGQDFSPKMIALAAAKMPKAHLYQSDFTEGLASPLRDRRYDYIVATYSLHHLTDEQKVAFFPILLELLNETGMILIGDVAFETRDALERCRQEAGDKWDDEEIYFVVEELRLTFPDLSFTPVSYCAGIITLTR